MFRFKSEVRLLFSILVVSIGIHADHIDPYFEPHRTGIVHLFEWKFSDIAKECTEYLGPNGFAAVQVSPVHENVVSSTRSWWERYQPISYKIATRSGNEKEFADMVAECERAGIRIYVDVVPNHMTAMRGNITGTGGSTADVDKRSYPAVPYTSEHFHPPCAISNYQNASEVRNCELVGLPDLNQTHPYVRSKIVEFMNRCIDHGVGGFRVDAAKHMWPKDLREMYSQLHDLKSNIRHIPLNAKPFIYQEVIDLGGEGVHESEYIEFGAVTEFRHSNELGRAFNGKNELKWLQSWGPAWNFVRSQNALVFVDNHDNQRTGGSDILTYKSPQRYVMATAFMLAQTYGIPRVMSSFAFVSTDQGPPAASDGTIESPKFNSTTGQCINGWVCEHRWPAIRNMIEFRNVVEDAKVVNFWSNDKNQIAFGRGTRGFIAFNLEPNDMNVTLFTSLPSGIYCDVITGDLAADGKCTGQKVFVDGNGEAEIFVKKDVGVLAIHVAASDSASPKVVYV